MQDNPYNTLYSQCTRFQATFNLVFIEVNDIALSIPPVPDEIRTKSLVYI